MSLLEISNFVLNMNINGITFSLSEVIFGYTREQNYLIDIINNFLQIKEKF